MKTTTLVRALAASALTLGLGAAAIASPGHDAAAHGAPGKASAASRTVDVEMFDNYYEPETIAVKAGETIRFRIVNRGDLVHEFNIGTAAMHAAHKGEMAMMVDMGVLLPDRIDRAAGKAMQASMGHGMHDDPNSKLLEPGQSAEIVWTFPNDGRIEFACNVPGHYEAGMQGDFTIGGGS